MEGRSWKLVRWQRLILLYLLRMFGRHSCLVSSDCHDHPILHHFHYSKRLTLVAHPFAVNWRISFSQMKHRTSTCSAIQLKQLVQRQKIVRMLFFILIGFFICFLPFTIIIIVRNRVVLGISINSVRRNFRVCFEVSVVDPWIIYSI